MAKRKKGCAQRTLQVPYTRTSRYREKSFIRMTKNPRIVRWHMGNTKSEYDYSLKLVIKEPMQLRDCSIESARQACNRVIEKAVTKESYYLKIRSYPHHVLRENPLAAGAGADRLSTGMKMAFGKPIGVAAQVRPGSVIMELFVQEAGVKAGHEALRRARTKLPGQYTVTEERLSPLPVKEE